MFSMIYKVHSSEMKKAQDGLEFIMSDETPDRYDDIIEAKDKGSWVLDSHNKNPIALFNHNSDAPIGVWKNTRVEGGALRGVLQLAPAGTSERIDEIRKLVDAGVLKAVSVGFRPMASTPRSESKVGGIRFTKSELLECSLVSVPANPNALAVVKSMRISRETQELIFAKHGNRDQLLHRGITGEHADTTRSNRKGQTMSPLSKRIETAQQRIVELKDELEAHIAKVDDENPQDEATAITEELTHRIDLQEKSLETLKKAEAQLAKSAGSTALTTVVDVTATRTSEQSMILPRGGRPFATPAKQVRPADYLFKAVAVAIKHFADDKRNVLDVLRESYGDGQEGEMVRTVMANMVTKAAAIPADTTTSHWASDLIQTVIGDFIASLIPYSIYPRLSGLGSSFTFGRNGVISLPSRNTATTVGGAFIAQGAAIPVKQGAFASITLTPKKMGVITTLTREITEHSQPSIEGIIRQAILEDTGIALDTILLDATAADTTRPAGLKNGVTKVTASATATIVGFIADIKGLTGALITNTKGNLRAPAWIMNPSDVLAAQLLQTTVGETPFRDEVAGGTLLGYPIIPSTTCTARTMFLVDAADFITATGDTPNFSVSDQAVLHMEDTSPAALSASATPNTVAAPIRSLWQTDTMAIRMIMDVNWAMRRTGVMQWSDTLVW